MFFDSSYPEMIDTGHQNEWADIEMPDGSVKMLLNEINVFPRNVSSQCFP